MTVQMYNMGLFKENGKETDRKHVKSCKMLKLNNQLFYNQYNMRYAK